MDECKCDQCSLYPCENHKQLDTMKNKKNTITYKVGYFIGSILALCCISVVIALTIKFILWIF